MSGMYSENTAKAINDFLLGDGWHFMFDDQKGVFRFDLGLKSQMKRVGIIIDVHENDYLVLASSPIGADANENRIMSSMAEFICRVNFGLKNGAFQLDMNDGEIRYKTYVDFEGIVPTPEIIRTSIYCPVVMFERYSAGIIDILFGNGSAKDALAKCGDTLEKQIQTLMDK